MNSEQLHAGSAWIKSRRASNVPQILRSIRAASLTASSAEAANEDARLNAQQTMDVLALQLEAGLGTDAIRGLFRLATTTGDKATQWLCSLQGGRFGRLLHAPGGIDTVCALARVHRVLPSVCASLREVCQEKSVPAWALRDVGRYARLREHYARQLKELTCGARISHGGLLVRKGTAISAYYPEHLVRQSGDIDLCAANERELWALCKWALSHGYALEGLGMAFPCGSDPRVWGLGFAITGEDPALGRLGGFEVFQEGVPVGERGWLRVTPLIHRALRGRPEGNQDQDIDTPVLLSEREDCLLMLLVESTERYLMARDAVDFAALTGMLPGSGHTLAPGVPVTQVGAARPTGAALSSGDATFDWSAFLPRVEAAGLCMAFVRVVRYFERVSHVAATPPARDAVTRWSNLYPWWHVIESIHELRSVPGERSMLKRAWSTGRQAALALYDRYSLERGLWPVGSPVLPHEAARWGRMLYLMPLGGANSGHAAGDAVRGFEYLTDKARWYLLTKHGLALRSPIGWFLASYGFDFTEDQLEEAAVEAERIEARKRQSMHVADGDKEG